MAPVLRAFDPTLLLVLNLAGTFVFGLSGGLEGVRARLDVFGVVVLAMVVGLAGGITRDLLIGIPPQTFRDWRYLAAGAAAGMVTFVAHAALTRLERPILILDAAGLALFCVTGASTALDHRVAPVEAVVLGAITGVGGGVLRDILVREIPVVLRTGLYAIPALIGAAVVVIASENGTHSLVVPIVGAGVCFAIRLVGIYFDLGVPRAPGRDHDVGETARARHGARQEGRTARAFVLAQSGRVRTASPTCLLPNLAGSGILAFVAAVDGVGFLLLEGVWAGVSGHSVVRLLAGAGDDARG